MKFVYLALGLLLLSGAVDARSPDNIESIQRETRILQDVMQSALRQELRQDVRITRLEAEYLAAQGVLVSVTLNTPWLKFDRKGEPSFEFHGNISLPEIPAMVNNILQDLQLNASPYEPDVLEELRDLREEQRDLRNDTREQRSRLRSLRRDLVREDDVGAKTDLEAEIKRLQEELALLEQQYEGLSQEIEQQYAQLRSQPKVPDAPQPASAPETPVNVNAVLARAVCDYAPTLKSLDAEEFVTVAIRRGQSSEYLAFRMDHVLACSRSANVEALLERAYQYKG